jgi:hypothetical protein
MRYLITTKSEEPFFTNWFESENNFDAKLEMIVYDLLNCLFTTDGKEWNTIQFDHL